MANIPFLNNATFAGTVSSTGLSVDTTGVIQLGDISGAGEGAVLQVDNVEGYVRAAGVLSLADGVIFENDVEIISNENSVEWYDVTDFSLSAVDSILLTSDLITLDKYGSGNANLVATSWNASFNSVTATTFLGDLNGTINTATTGVTQTAGNNSTLIATTAYADAAAGAVPIGNYLPLAGGTMTGNIAMGNNDITGLSQLAFTDNLRFDDLGADNYLRLTYGDAGPGGLQIYDGDNTLQGYLYADGGGTSSFGLLSGAGQWGVKVVEGANTSLYHSGTQKLFTTTTGIDVTGTAQMDTGITEGIHYVGTAVEHWGDGGTGMSFPANDTLSLKTASSDRLYINSSGNVGIGTTSPTVNLQVHDASSSQIKITNGLATPVDLQLFASSSSYAGIGTASDHRLAIRTNNTEKVTVLSNGNVGIGTVSPDEKLEIAGSLLLANNSDIKFNNSAGNKISTIRYNSSNQLIIANGNSPNGDIHFQSDVTSGLMMILDGATDYVGIGNNTSPKSMLDVQGGIKMADDTDTASATKVGTMRYRTGTEYVEVTGVDLVTNGDFATDSDWTKGTGWTISGGTASAVSATGELSQTGINFDTSKIYRVGYVISGYSGSGGVKARLKGAVWNTGILREGNGSFTETITSTGENFVFAFVTSSSFTGSIDNVSVMEVTAEDASYADMCMQTGASTYEWVNIVRNTY